MTKENFENINPENRLPSEGEKKEVADFLEYIFQCCAQMGNNDKERSELKRIQSEFDGGLINMQEAKMRGEMVLANKHDH